MLLRPQCPTKSGALFSFPFPSLGLLIYLAAKVDAIGAAVLFSERGPVGLMTVQHSRLVPPNGRTSNQTIKHSGGKNKTHNATRHTGTVRKKQAARRAATVTNGETNKYTNRQDGQRWWWQTTPITPTTRYTHTHTHIPPRALSTPSYIVVLL